MIYAEGEDERVLRAVQIVVDEKLAQPILIGRPEVVEMRIQKLRAAHAGRARISSSSIRKATRATATSGPSTTGSCSRKGVSPDDAQGARARSPRP